VADRWPRPVGAKWRWYWAARSGKLDGPEMGSAGPNRISSFSFFFSLFSNSSCVQILIQTLVTKYSQMILRQKQNYFEDILLFILFLYLFSFWFHF
jgi:hypothetical protein